MSPSKHLSEFEDERVWTIEAAHAQLIAHGPEITRRTAERRLHELGILPDELDGARLQDEWGRKVIGLVLDGQIAHARARRKLVLFAQLHPLPSGRPCLHFNDARGARLWIPLASPNPSSSDVADALARLHTHLAKDFVVFPHLQLAEHCRGLPASAATDMLAYPPKAQFDAARHVTRAAARSTHLARLEAESIHILREAIAEAHAPVMLYSIGKDSSVLLHLARKAFFPSPPPFPLLHVDTQWKFRQMYEFRDSVARTSGMELLLHTNPEAISKGINPFDHGSSLHTHITKTEGLKQALDAHKFDVILGGARRDEEKSRAKERIFSFRTASHAWDPKKQRPELWNLYNVRKNAGESIRVFPLSNWTELDIWQYIDQEGIPVVPLYFAQIRPVVMRDGAIIMVDDDRMRLHPGEVIQARSIRFRTLGCYPLTGAVESTARTLPEIIAELITATHSERQGRVIDSDAASSMEKKKQEGYF